MNEYIMRDNILYLQAWMNYNPSLKDNLTIDGTNLVCKIEDKIEYLDIKNFYLANMLYNEQFRSSIALDKELSAEDLFQIIKLYIQTEKIVEKEQKDLELYATITDFQVKKDKDGNEFIYMLDNLNRKYRFDTKEPEKIIQYYNDLKAKKNVVTLKELGSVIKSDN